jgi:Na+-transporting NADH:ubiquinone oxidoreductase subunit NqrC
MDKFVTDLKNRQTNKEDLHHQKGILDVASVMLKDTGIKTKIIKQYVPIMNKLINKYLAAMDFFVQFELDENFNEKIKSRFRDEFTYASFSEGEKMRIDLALLFTWRSIAKLRNSASTNLLIMDEVFDSSLDNTGTEEFLKILESLTVDTNVFVISHKGDQLYDKFHSVIKFEKTKNFSRIAA